MPASLGCAATVCPVRALKVDEPNIQHTMKVEKIWPNGTVCPTSAAFMAGGHCSTKMYMAPSKNA